MPVDSWLTPTQIDVQTHRRRDTGLGFPLGLDDHQVGPPIGIEILDSDEGEIQGRLAELQAQIGRRRIPTSIPATMNGHRFPAADLQEIDAAVAVEVALRTGRAVPPAGSSS